MLAVAFVCGMGLLFLINAGIGYRRRIRSRTWVRTRGRVTLNLMSQGGPNFLYSYEFRGKHYNGNRISATTGVISMATTRVVEKYKPDDEITVWVDPECPTESCVIRGSRHDPKITALVGLAFIALGLTLLLLV